jgi:hypothetical protein
MLVLSPYCTNILQISAFLISKDSDRLLKLKCVGLKLESAAFQMPPSNIG